MERIIIIGGGPSGITTAINAKRDDNEVIVLERNTKPLKKLLMTGNGKCNYMNEVYGTKNYHSEDIALVDKIISTKNIEMMRKFFADLGIIPKIKNGYYYPFSNQATTIEKALLKEVKNKGIIIECDTLVENIKKKDNCFEIKTNNNIYLCDKLVLATGSFAYPKTGSDGKGYTFLKALGHTIIKPLPALVPLVGKGNYFKIWQGVRADVSIELFEDGKYIAKEEGEIQLTDYGISGICIFQLSHFVTRGLIENKKEEIHINFVPFIETLITPWMDNYSKKHQDKNLQELLEGFLNYKLVKVIIKQSNLQEDSFYLDLSNEEKLTLCKNLRSFKIEISDTKGFDYAQICNGGVKLTEININTMESEKVENLYIVGELLDINGNCGGYNLTICWLSGILAGLSIGEKND